ncbi:MAG: HAMP domain-containing protein [Xanthomonadaceae bacterium]|nr:HAMP domain-containing protein [Xanthomonadaceae bacterium]
MKTLFLRIFFAFWAAMLVVLGTTAGVAYYRFHEVKRVNVDIKELANEAAALLRSDGTQALPAWIADSERKYKERSIFIVDSTGDDVLKRPLPHHLRKYVGRLQDAGLLGRNKIDSRDIDDPLLLTPLFTDRDGTVYSLMISGPSWPMNMLNATDVRIVVLAFALLTSAFVCWWIARYVSKPVERLQSSARSIAAGNLEARVGTEFSRRKDELGVLARDFDAMADHVRALIASKEDLLRGMSHELRSPLARLRVALGLARRSGEDLARQLDRIELETERLDTLIGQMLQLSQLRAAEPVHTREPVDVATLLGEVVEDARLEASAVNKRVDWVPSAGIIVDGEQRLLRSAIENVLRNAIRFADTGTAVMVKLRFEHGRATILIEDRGPGVPPAELDNIFEPFYRVAASRDRDSGGTGLGLAITWRVVALHGGQVVARNASGGGLIVQIELPARSVHASAA